MDSKLGKKKGKTIRGLCSLKKCQGQWIDCLTRVEVRIPQYTWKAEKIDNGSWRNACLESKFHK